MRMYQIKIFYIFATYLRETYLFSKKIAFAAKLRLIIFGVMTAKKLI